MHPGIGLKEFQKFHCYKSNIFEFIRTFRRIIALNFQIRVKKSRENHPGFVTSIVYFIRN
jgi:hypothetical protein